MNDNNQNDSEINWNEKRKPGQEARELAGATD